MRPCDEITELISAALDDMLTEQEQAELDSHLAACPACSALYAQLSALHQTCADLEELSAPEGFCARVMERIAAESAREQPTNVVPFPAKKGGRSPWKRWGVTAAAVAIVALGAVSLPGQLGMGTKNAAMDIAAPEAMMANDIAEFHTQYSAKVKESAAPMSPTDAKPALAEEDHSALMDCEPAESAASVEPAESAAPVPIPTSIPNNSLIRDAGINWDTLGIDPSLLVLGPLTISAQDAPADLEDFDVQSAADGTKTYAVPAAYFFTLEGSEQFNPLSDSDGAYGLVIVTP